MPKNENRHGAASKLGRRTWARGVTTDYTYDPATGEQTGINYSDATPDLAYTSDRLGQTATVSDSTAANPDADLQQTYGYTGAGRFETLTSSLSPSLSLPSRTFTYGYLPDAPLVGSLHAATGVHDFFVTRTYDPQRDLLASIRADWDAATVTRHDYTHDTSGRRISRAQSGSAFADYGEPTFRRYTYNARSEVTGAPDYLGSIVTDTTKPLPGRQHAYDFDSLGNRKWADRTGDPAQREDYTTNALNQIVTKENLSLPAQGTVDSATTTVSADGAPATARQGRFFSSEVLVANSANPWAGNVTVHATKNVAGVNYVRTDTRLAFLPQAAQAFTYDLDGNMTSDGLWTYTFDADAARKRGDGQASRLARKGESSGCPPGSEARQNRLTTMTAAAGAVTGGFQNRRLEFKYDYLGRRVQKAVQEWSGAAWSVVSARRFLYDGFNLVAELTVSPLSSDVSMVRSYTWGLDLTGGLTAAGGVGGLVQIRDTAQGKTLLPSYDGNGHVASLVNADTGALEAAYEYDPFGQLLRAEGAYAKENPFRFSTQFVDDETGLVYHNARYYNPNLGRFINRDPIEESGGLNLYAYVSNDSANKWDNFGKSDGSLNGFFGDGDFVSSLTGSDGWSGDIYAPAISYDDAYSAFGAAGVRDNTLFIDTVTGNLVATQSDGVGTFNYTNFGVALLDVTGNLEEAIRQSPDFNPGPSADNSSSVGAADAATAGTPSEVAAAQPDVASTTVPPSSTTVSSAATPDTALNTVPMTNTDAASNSASVVLGALPKTVAIAGSASKGVTIVGSNSSNPAAVVADAKATLTFLINNSPTLDNAVKTVVDIKGFIGIHGCPVMSS